MGLEEVQSGMRGSVKVRCLGCSLEYLNFQSLLCGTEIDYMIWNSQKDMDESIFRLWSYHGMK